MEELPERLTTREAMAYLRCSDGALHAHRLAGRLVAWQRGGPGGGWLWDRESVKALLVPYEAPGGGGVRTKARASGAAAGALQRLKKKGYG